MWQHNRLLQIFYKTSLDIIDENQKGCHPESEYESYLEPPVVLEGALLTSDEVRTAAAVEDIVESVRGCDAVGRGRLR